MAKLTVRTLLDLKPGQNLADPQVNGDGYALRYRQKAGGLYAEFMHKVAPGKWKFLSLGAVDVDARIHDLSADRHPALEPPYQPTLDDILAPVRERAHATRRQVKASGSADGITLRTALELHLGSKARSPRTVQEYKDKVKLHLADWLDKPLASLSRTMVRDRHRLLSRDHGPYAANGVMRILRAVWNRARKQHPELPEAPTINVDFNPETRRDAAIPLALLPQWWADVHALENATRRDFYWLTLFTGLRRRTAEGIRREHIDLDARTLLISNPKGGAKRAFTLPLSGYLVELIEARLAANGDCEWLFPATSASGHITEPKVNGGWRGVPFTVHGLRNTYISAATAAGVHPYHIKLLVNHAVPKADVTAGYLGRDVDALREPQQRVTDWLLARLGNSTVL